MTSTFNAFDEVNTSMEWQRELLPNRVILPKIEPTKEPLLTTAYYSFKDKGYLDNTHLAGINDDCIKLNLTSEDKSNQRVLIDGDFLLTIEKVTKSKLIKSIRNHFITKLITAKVKKTEIQNYLADLNRLQTQGKCTPELLQQLLKLDLVPFKDHFNDTLLVPWHIAIFTLTFKHDITSFRPGYGN